MEAETFYGVTLSEKEPLAQFEVAESEKYDRDQKLIIKQIILGAEAKDGEFNVVQAETRVGEKDTLKIPIAVLKAGETRALTPNIEFPSASVTFKLIQGTGPVHILGQHDINEADVEEAYYEEEEGEEYDEDGPHSENQTTNGKSSNNHKRK